MASLVSSLGQMTRLGDISLNGDSSGGRDGWCVNGVKVVAHCKELQSDVQALKELTTHHNILMPMDENRTPSEALGQRAWQKEPQRNGAFSNIVSLHTKSGRLSPHSFH